jgi:hypothetical protein
MVFWTSPTAVGCARPVITRYASTPPRMRRPSLSLLSHTFPGHLKIVRSGTVSDRKQIQLVMWADSVSERMDLVDRIWRRITEPIAPGKASSRPKLVQLVRCGTYWAYPLYLDGSVTRVLPHGGMPAPVANKELGKK